MKKLKQLVCNHEYSNTKYVKGRDKTKGEYYVKCVKCGKEVGV